MTRPGLPRPLGIRGPGVTAVHRFAACAALLASLLVSFTVLAPRSEVPGAGAVAPTQVFGNGVRMAGDPDGGYWTTSPSGSVRGHGGAPTYGSLTPGTSKWPIVAMAPTSDGAGYWLVTSNGDVFAFGDAQPYGSTGEMHLNQPVVGMSPTPDGDGYWLVASDGGVFAFGDAPFWGSATPLSPPRPVVGMAATPDGSGYWLVTAGGSVYTFGSAPFEGWISPTHNRGSIVAMAPTADGNGYWLAAGNGDVYHFGDAANFRSRGGRGLRAAGLIVSSDQPGYTLVETNGRSQYRGPASPDTVPSSSTPTASPSPTVPPTTSTTPPFSGGLSSVLGVYGGSGDPQPISDFAASGIHALYAMDFLDGTSWATIGQSGYPFDAWKGSGYSMIWGVDMLPNTFSPNSSVTAAGGSCSGLTQEAAGDFNAYFKTVAQNIIAAGFSSSVIRLGWEFNGGWFPWSAGGCPSAFVGAFQQIVTAMRSATGQSFTFEWNPTIGDLGDGDLATYYPGDTYVDYVGLDVYDVSWGTYSGADSEFAAMETEPYGLNWLASFGAAHNKPLVFPEWGLGWGTCSASGQAISATNTQVCGGDDATFVTDMADWFAYHNVVEATYWDYGTSSLDRGSNPATAHALVNDFG